MPPRAKCPHGRRRYRCVDCGGTGICTHDRLRARCIECGGSAICVHGRRRAECKDCGGSQICSHGRRRPTCKDCEGSQICSHGRLQAQCKDCGGVSICTHGKQRAQCKDCGGSSICSHGINRQGCAVCDPKHALCRQCGLFIVGGRKLCSYCDPKSSKRKKYDERRPEIKTLKAVQAAFPQANIFHDSAIGGACGTVNRPDIFFVRNWIPDRSPLWIVIEIDEGAHSDRESTCEWARLFTLASLFATTPQPYPVVFIRFNPGTTEGVLQKRLPLLLETISSIQPTSSEELTVAFLYYTKVYPGQDLYLMSSNELEGQLQLFKNTPPQAQIESME